VRRSEDRRQADDRDSSRSSRASSPTSRKYHKLKYTNEAVKAAVELSAKYQRPQAADKAIDVIDEAGASQMLVPEKRKRRSASRRWRPPSPPWRASLKTITKSDAECCPISTRT
jgi:ATP-dependent Clp protease ATP-binding subunit ClpA